MNEQKRFSAYGEKIRKMFPVWTAIRKDPSSIGAQFLSVIGMRLDEIQWMLDYAYEQTKIGKADIHQIDHVYRARIPNSLRPGMNFRFMGGAHVLHPAASEVAFLQHDRDESVHGALQEDTACWIDFQEKLVYVKRPFDADEEYKDGRISLSIYETEEPIHERLPLLLNPVWNTFDEMGLLLGASRLHGETNASYKERILDIFRRPASSTKEGLLNGVARELGLTRRLRWSEPEKPLTLSEPRIEVSSIRLDNAPTTRYEIDNSGRIVLIPTGEEEPVEVSYIAGASIHELHDKEDAAFQRELYDIDGNETPLLTYYVEAIHRQAPIMWGNWRWDEGTWETGTMGYAGYTSLPVSYDAEFAGWAEEEET